MKKIPNLLLIAFLLCLMQPFTAMGAEESVKADESKKAEDANTEEDRKLPKLNPGEWQPLFEMGENIFPSVAISTATLKEGIWDDKQHLGDPWGVIGIVVRGAENNCPVKVEISGETFIKPSVFTGTLADKDTTYCVYPSLRYNYEKLLSVKQTVPETLTFKVAMGGKEKPEMTVRVQVRTINECVFYFADSSGGINDVSALFAGYVNENHPIISKIMKDALAARRVESFAGYQGDEDDVMGEITAVWDTLKKRGIRYSSISAGNEDGNPHLGTQYVRLLGESANSSQANCVDGSVLMASIFRRMGLNTSLVELPDHMFVAVDLDAEGKKTIYIETTDLADGDIDEAIKDGDEQYAENRNKFDSQKEDDQDYNIINIQAARSMGIMPIKDSSVN